MNPLICLSCAQLRTDDVGSTCPTCGGELVAAHEPELERLVRVKLRRRIDGWRQQGILAPAMAERLKKTLEAPDEALPMKPAPGPAAAADAWAFGMAASIRQVASWRPGWGTAFFRSMEEAAQAEREAARHGTHGQGHGSEEGEGDLGLAMGSGSALFGQGATGALGGGLEALAALDSDGSAAGREGSLKLHEYVWWFLGALLVLGGSLMGVREAWKALGGVPRQLIVTGALFVYHAGFIGLGSFLARRSLSAGRVLAGIGLALTPVVFVALAALVAMTPVVGVPCALVVAGLCLPTLRMAGRLLHGTSLVALAGALLPSLLASLPLMWLEDAPWPRALCAFAGVAALGGSLWQSARAGKGLAPLVSAGVALYGALALALFSVASGVDGFDALTPGTPTFTAMALWTVALAGVIASAAMRDSVRDAYPRAAPVVEVAAHAAVAGGVLSGLLAAFSLVPGSEPWVDVLSAFTPAAGALIFFLLEPRRRALVHLAVPAAVLAGLLLARLQVPGEVAWWFVGPAAVASGIILVARQVESAGLRNRLLVWSVSLALVSMPLVSMVASGWGSMNAWPQVVTGAMVAVAAHLAAGHRWRGLHYLGGLAVPFAALASLNNFPALSSPWATLAVFALAAVLYGLAALVHGVWARRERVRQGLSPLDDLSLAGGSLAVLLCLMAGVTPWPSQVLGLSEGLRLSALLSCAPIALVSALLLLRVSRDKSRLVSFLAASGVALTVVQFCALVRDTSQPTSLALVPAALVLGFALLAALRGRSAASIAERPDGVILIGRRLLGFIYLPFSESGRPLFTDGFAGAALVLVLVSIWCLAGWTSTPLEAERSWNLLASGLLVAGGLVAFFTRGFVAWRLRGSVVALAAGGGFIALTAIVNRAGRPLPPDIVAWRMPLIGVGLWALALVARRFGPWLGRKLENEPQGSLYHWVPHAGVAALVLVLVKGALGVGAPNLSRALGVVPPLMPLGAGLLSLLLAASLRQRWLVHLGLVLGLPGAALWSAQHALVGPGLTALVPPSGQWVRTDALGNLSGDWLASSAWMPPGATVVLLWQWAFAGIAAAGLAYAGAALVQAQVGAQLAFLRRMVSWVPEEARADHEQSLVSFADGLLEALRDWAFTAGALVFAAAFFQPGLSAAVLTLAMGAVLVLGGSRSQGRRVVGAGILLGVHAVAHQAPHVAGWPGPVLAVVGLAVVVLGPWMARLRGLDEEKVLIRTHLAAALYALCGTVYAMAAGGVTDPLMAVPQLVSEAFGRLDGRWLLSPAFPITAAVVAITVLVGAFQWKGVLASIGAALGSVLAGLAGLCGLSVVLVARAGGGWAQADYGLLLSRSGAMLALGAAVSAAVAHAAVQWLQERRGDVARGLVLGRDVGLGACGALLAAVAVFVRSPGADLLPWALAALGLAVMVALHCAWSAHTGRHVYVVQVAVVGLYAMVRTLYATGLRPEHDALFALGLGFALVGVTVLARRAGIPPVADATRRFAALLPVLMWWVLPTEASQGAALFAGGSGLLYAALGAVEHSRWFGSLAATACNLALLVAALAFGLDGLEIYLAPLGLLLVMLSQLFSDSLPQAARNGVRVLGGFLLYVPSAAKLSLQVGLASDGTYALVFGGACLLGVAVGMVFHIRAYLALGTLFLTLDVVANLVHAGLRDHRVGFVVMTLAGLSIVTGRVMATLRRQQLDMWMRRVRVELRGWD